MKKKAHQLMKSLFADEEKNLPTRFEYKEVNQISEETTSHTAKHLSQPLLIEIAPLSATSFVNHRNHSDTDEKVTFVAPCETEYTYLELRRTANQIYKSIVVYRDNSNCLDKIFTPAMTAVSISAEQHSRESRATLIELALAEVAQEMKKIITKINFGYEVNEELVRLENRTEEILNEFFYSTEYSTWRLRLREILNNGSEIKYEDKPNMIASCRAGSKNCFFERRIYQKNPISTSIQ